MFEKMSAGDLCTLRHTATHTHVHPHCYVRITVASRDMKTAMETLQSAIWPVSSLCFRNPLAAIWAGS